MRNITREKYRFTARGLELLFSNNKIQFAIQDVNPLILVAVRMFWAAGAVREFKNAHGACGVRARNLAVDRLKPEPR